MSLNFGSSNMALLVNTMPMVAAILMRVHVTKFLLICPVTAGCGGAKFGESNFSKDFSFDICTSRSKSLSDESDDPRVDDIVVV